MPRIECRRIQQLHIPRRTSRDHHHTFSLSSTLAYHIRWSVILLTLRYTLFTMGLPLTIQAYRHLRATLEDLPTLRQHRGMDAGMDQGVNGLRPRGQAIQLMGPSSCPP